MTSERAVPPGAAEPADGASEDSIVILMDKRVDLVISIAVAVFGVVICVVASGLRTGSFPDPLTPRGMPYITGGFMIAAGLFGVAKRLVTWNGLPGRYAVSEGKEDDPAHPSSSLRPFGILALALGWCALVHALGYLIVTPPMIFGMAWLMNVRSRAKLIGFPIVYTLAVWVVFSQVLDVILPLGPLTGIARSWGLTP